tara:strand:+ start:3009 stop:3281 length:273 start_codon:yes stop_codon:yes gene_type:complete
MTGVGVMAAMAVVGTGLSVVKAIQGPPKPPAMPAMPVSKVEAARKDANKDTANAIKSAKQRSGIATPNTLLTGSTGVGDEELNLGGNRLV